MRKRTRPLIFWLKRLTVVHTGHTSYCDPGILTRFLWHVLHRFAAIVAMFVLF
ncbi:hypothetical protein Hdeb2414_s0003g00096421 [Helianthus debilis subsp. tardiflorus]